MPVAKRIVCNIAGEKKAEKIIEVAVKTGKITARVGAKLSRAIPILGQVPTAYEIYEAIQIYKKEKEKEED